MRCVLLYFNLSIYRVFIVLTLVSLYLAKTCRSLWDQLSMSGPNICFWPRAKKLFLAIFSKNKLWYKKRKVFGKYIYRGQ